MRTHARNFARMAAYLNGTSHQGKARENDRQALQPCGQARANPYESGKWGHDSQASHRKRRGPLLLVSPTYYSTASV